MTASSSSLKPGTDRLVRSEQSGPGSRDRLPGRFHPRVSSARDLLCDLDFGTRGLPAHDALGIVLDIGVAQLRSGLRGRTVGRALLVGAVGDDQGTLVGG